MPGSLTTGTHVEMSIYSFWLSLFCSHFDSPLPKWHLSGALNPHLSVSEEKVKDLYHSVGWERWFKNIQVCVFTKALLSSEVR